ncbi:MAG: hypothetical protein QM691_06435 [Opitutaceae bacterium]
MIAAAALLDAPAPIAAPVAPAATDSETMPAEGAAPQPANAIPAAVSAWSDLATTVALPPAAGAAATALSAESEDNGKAPAAPAKSSASSERLAPSPHAAEGMTPNTPLAVSADAEPLPASPASTSAAPVLPTAAASPANGALVSLQDGGASQSSTSPQPARVAQPTDTTSSVEAAPKSEATSAGELPDDSVETLGAEEPSTQVAAQRLERLMAAVGADVVVTTPRAAAATSAEAARGPAVSPTTVSSPESARPSETSTAESPDAAPPLAGEPPVARETPVLRQTSAVVAVRTLAQVLAENASATKPGVSGKPAAVASTSSAAASTADMTTPAAGISTTATPDEAQPTAIPVGTKAPLPEGTPAASRTADASDTPPPAAEAETSTRVPGAASRERAENLAVARNTNARTAARTETTTRGRNFLDVERQSVEKRAASLGTGIAKETQTMSAQTPVLPPVSAALDSIEPVAAGVTTAQATSIHTPKSADATHAVRSHAAELVRETLEVAERAQAASRNQVELRLPSGDGDLRVHLRWQDGVVHAKFVTHDTDLQQALSREWEHAAPKLADKGLKFGEPSFENRDQSGQSAAQNASNFDQQRHSSRGQSHDGSERAPEFSLRPSAASTTASARRTATPAAATTAVAHKPSDTGTRGLRAWA